MNTILSREELPTPADQVSYLLSTATRAPSVHKTQPWRFRVNPCDIEITASYDNGILEIVVPLSEAEPTGQRIEITPTS